MGIDLNRVDGPRSIVVAGSYRSGTTWISTTLAEAFGAEHNFEPLEPSYTTTVRDLSLRNRYLRPDGHYPEEHRFLTRLIQGKLYRLPIKVMSRNPLHLYKWKWWRRLKLHKLIQGHLLLPYLVEKFEVPVVFVTRHPCGVIESLTRQSWWHSDLPEFFDGRNDELWEDHPEFYERVQESLLYLACTISDGSFEHLLPREERIRRTAIRWCIENAFALEAAPNHGFLVINYESFCLYPNEVIKWISERLKISRFQIPGSLAEPSAKTDSNSPLYSASADPVKYWQQRLEKSEIRSIFEILSSFGLASDYELMLPSAEILDEKGKLFAC